MIQEILDLEHPYLVDHGNVQFTEEENLAMLRLPRKECEFTRLVDAFRSQYISCQTSRHRSRHMICT